jgi:hypothetical protein
VGVRGYPTLAIMTSDDVGLVEFYPSGRAKRKDLILEATDSQTSCR